MTTTIDWQELFGLLAYHPARPMLFNSMPFLVLFVLFYGGYTLLLRRLNGRILYTLLFSFFFYYKSSGFFFLLLIISAAADFVLGHFIYHASNRRRRQLFLFLSLAVNLGILFYYKYTNFFITSLNSLAGAQFSLTDIFLPVGISFFTFQTLSYSIDVYRGDLAPLTEKVHNWSSLARHFMDFAFFVSFFPQLVAGPIVRAAEFLPQIRQKPVLTNDALGKGLLLIMGGLIKKAVISDYISVNFVDRVFENPTLYSGLENLLAAYGYAIQIYCDFSGYSDMAIGLALLLGFQLPENFRTPYRATGIQEFWRRWHISLSSWLRDYLYISLGGNRKGNVRTYLHLLITMLLGGLWHGAGWVFIVWGGLHGLALAIDRALRSAGSWMRNPGLRAFCILLIIHLAVYALTAYRMFAGSLDPGSGQTIYLGNSIVLVFWLLLLMTGYLLDLLSPRPEAYRAGKVVGTILTFHFVTFCWIFFRSGALGAALPPLETTAGVLWQMVAFPNFGSLLQWIGSYPEVFLLLGLGFILHYLPDRWYAGGERFFLRSPALVKSTALALVIWIVIQTAGSDVVPFIYFQF